MRIVEKTKEEDKGEELNRFRRAQNM